MVDELPHLLGDITDGWATSARLPPPEQTEAGPVPPDHGVWLDNDKHVRPARPEPGKHEPEGAVTLAQARAAGCALEVGQLLAQGEVLDCEVRAAMEGGTQRSKEAEEQGTHRVIMRDGEAWRPNPLSIIATVGKHTSRTTSWRTTPGRIAACDGDLREFPWIVPDPGEDAALDEGEVAIDVAPIGQSEPHHMVMEDAGLQELDQDFSPAGVGTILSGASDGTLKILCPTRSSCSRCDRSS